MIFDRSHFPQLKRTVNNSPLAFLDNAATTLKPYGVLEAMEQFYRHSYAPVHRGIYTLAEEATQAYEDARVAVARFINAHPEEIIFTRGTTESINAAASMWAKNHLQAGDEIAVTALEHHANLLPWQRIAEQRGARLVILPITHDGMLDMQQAGQLIGPHTKLVAACMTSNAIGTHVDVKTLAQLAHAFGAHMFVDAAQAVPHQVIDVHELDCDFLAFSGHKMLGPTGIGVLYVRRELQECLEPYQLGGGMVLHASHTSATWAKPPVCFEAGTPPIVEAVGLTVAITYLEKINFNHLRQHEAALCAHLIDGLQALGGVRILGPIEYLKKHGHVVSFVIPGMHAHDVAAAADQVGICVRAGSLCAQPLLHDLGCESVVRASFYGYNTIEEVERLLGVVQRCTKGCV